jgi:hypothetical protein
VFCLVPTCYWKGNAVLHSTLGIRTSPKVASVIECKWNRFEMPSVNENQSRMRRYVVWVEASVHVFTLSVWHMKLGNSRQLLHDLRGCILFGTQKPYQNSGHSAPSSRRNCRVLRQEWVKWPVLKCAQQRNEMSAECKHRSIFAESSARCVACVWQEHTALNAEYNSQYLVGLWVGVSGKWDENNANRPRLEYKVFWFPCPRYIHYTDWAIRLFSGHESGNSYNSSVLRQWRMLRYSEFSAAIPLKRRKWRHSCIKNEK